MGDGERERLLDCLAASACFADVEDELELDISLLFKSKTREKRGKKKRKLICIQERLFFSSHEKIT